MSQCNGVLDSGLGLASGAWRPLEEGGGRADVRREDSAQMGVSQCHACRHRASSRRARPARRSLSRAPPLPIRRSGSFRGVHLLRPSKATKTEVESGVPVPYPPFPLPPFIPSSNEEPSVSAVESRF